MLNRKQVIVLITGIALIILSELFPPWLRDGADVQGEISCGYHYHLIQSFPSLPGTMYYRVNTTRLWLQHLLLFFASSGLILLLKNHRNDSYYIGATLLMFLATLITLALLGDVFIYGI